MRKYEINKLCRQTRTHSFVIQFWIDALAISDINIQLMTSWREVNEKLYDLSGTEVSLRQIREDIKFMRDSAGYNVPIEAYPLEGRKCYY